MKFKQSLGVFVILSILLLLQFPVIAQQKVGWQASRETVDKLSKGQTTFNYEESKVPVYTLPDLLTSTNGKKIVNQPDWLKIRRPELLELFTSQVFGRVPETAYQKNSRIVKTDPIAMNGLATLKLIDIEITSKSKSSTIHLGLFTPNKATKPVPAFLLICNRVPDNIDFTREKKSEFWPAEEVIARGYAVAAFYNADVDPDVDDQFKDGIHGLLDTERTAESWGTIAAWAWGASRCMDYLVTDKQIASDKIAVVGHSRGAKTALWAGATDKRIAMVVCNEAGCGGSSLSHRRYGETIERINTAFPHWFCTNFRGYNNKEDSMPFDSHMLMALIAPRPLYVASADKDLWGDPRGQYLSLYHSVPVYNLLGVPSDIPQTMPQMNVPVISGKVAYHVRDGEHNLLLKDWNFFMDFADLTLKQN